MLENSISELLDFKNFKGGGAVPHTPLEVRASGARCMQPHHKTFR